MPVAFLLSALAFHSAVYTLLPTLPLILLGRGASPAQVGVVMGAFTAAALLCRVPVGMLLARRPPEPFLRRGQLAMGLGFLAYLAPAGLLPVLAGRVLQGVGLAAFNTSAYIYLAERAGPSRRAQYVSLFGLSANVAMGLAPAAGSILLEHAGAVPLFTAGAALAALGYWAAPRTRLPPGGAGRPRLWEPGVWKPATAMLGLALAYGTIMVFVPLAIARANLTHGWLFFSGYSVAIVTTRLATHRILDRGARLRWAFGGSGSVLVALILLARASSWGGFLAAALLFGAGVGTGHPSLMVYILEAVPPERRSGAAAMGSAAFDAGWAAGATVAGWVATQLSYSAAFVCSAALFALLFLPLAREAARSAVVPSDPP